MSRTPAVSDARRGPSWPRWSRVLLGALVVASLATVAEPPAGAATSRRVVVLGDSITHGSTPQIEAVFKVLQGWPNTFVNGVSGHTVTQRQQDIRDYVRFFTPDVLVIQLGTNDMGGVAFGSVPPSSEVMQSRFAQAVSAMRRTLADVAHVRCVVWVNVSDWTRWRVPGYPMHYLDLATWGPRYNAVLRNEDAARANLHVIEYAATIRSRRQYPSETSFLPWLAANYNDGGPLIHPSTTHGKQDFAAILARGVERSCGI